MKDMILVSAIYTEGDPDTFKGFVVHLGDGEDRWFGGDILDAWHGAAGYAAGAADARKSKWGRMSSVDNLLSDMKARPPVYRSTNGIPEFFPKPHVGYDVQHIIPGVADRAMTTAG